MTSLGLHYLITKPSRITKTSSTLIDNILTNNILYEHISGLIFEDLSDHLPIFTLCKNDNLSFQVNDSVYIRKINEKTIKNLRTIHNYLHKSLLQMFSSNKN